MKLVRLRGTDCYFSCVVSIAASMSIPYLDSFATLWSETDFRHNTMYDICQSKRMISNLEAMGMKLCDCAAVLPEDGTMIVGMDAYHIPWSPVYQALHDPHYFIVRCDQPETLVCFDPTYDKQHESILREDIAAHAVEILQIEPVTPMFSPTEIAQEARSVLESHPKALDMLLSQLGENAAFLGKYVGAMINNRQLFKHYLETVSPGDPFFDAAFFTRWTAVKNGLYKASLIEDKTKVLRELSELIRTLFAEEMNAAQRLKEAVANDALFLV